MEEYTKPDEDSEVSEEFKKKVEEAKKAGSSLTDRLKSLGESEFDKPKENKKP